MFQCKNVQILKKFYENLTQEFLVTPNLAHPSGSETYFHWNSGAIGVTLSTKHLQVPIGYLSVGVDRKALYVHALFKDRRARTNGILTSLIKKLIEALGIKNICLWDASSGYWTKFSSNYPNIKWDLQYNKYKTRRSLFL